MENQEESKKEVEETIIQSDSTDKEKPEQLKDDEGAQKPDVVEDEKVELSKKELETLRKKAEDFERMTQTKRGQKILEKMNKPATSDSDDDSDEPNPVIDMDQVIAEATRVAEEAALRVSGGVKQEELKVNLESAYEDWIKKNPWADNDDIFKDIFANIRPTNSSKKEDLLAELDRAAVSAHPGLYAQAMESRLRAEILVEQNKIDVGAGGGSVSVKKNNDADVALTKEDENIIDKYFGGDKERYLKVKNNNN